MTLFESDSQYRETSALWRIFSLLPLYTSLLDDHVWRWFAINIPMSLVSGHEFEGDIDIIAKLRYPPKEWVFRAWEAKVSLLYRDGSSQSLTQKKTAKAFNQVHKYRAFGAPEVCLLDIFLCEDGTLENGIFPTIEVRESMTVKQTELIKGGYGYHVIPFQHWKAEDNDHGLSMVGGGFPGTNTALTPIATPMKEPFSDLIKRLDGFYETTGGNTKEQITFCLKCQSLQRVKVMEEICCRSCGASFLGQPDYDNTFSIPSFQLPKECRSPT